MAADVQRRTRDTDSAAAYVNPEDELRFPTNRQGRWRSPTGTV